MASLSDLASVTAPAAPAGFRLADLALMGALGQSSANVGRERVLRNFNKFDLPDLLSGQAARGALHSSATRDKYQRLATGAGDNLADIQMGLAAQQAGLASNALLAQTGISLGGHANVLGGYASNLGGYY